MWTSSILCVNSLYCITIKMVLCKLASERKENHVSKKERKKVNKQTSKQKENKSACISFINVPYV